MKDPIELTVYAAPKDGERRGAVLYRARHRVHSGKQTFALVVPQALTFPPSSNDRWPGFANPLLTSHRVINELHQASGSNHEA